MLIKFMRVGCIFATLVCATLVSGAERSQPAKSLVNHKAPQFALPDLHGRRVDLAGMRGKVVLLNFWATWCAPCEAEMPVFSGWQQKYGAKGLQVIGISMDDSAGPVRKLVARLKPDYAIAMGNAELGDRYGGVLGLPLTYLIDRKGIVRAQFQGMADLRAMERRLQELLEQP